MTLILLFLTSFISAFVQSTTGFGYGILFMAISPYYLPYNIAQVLSISTSPLGNIANAAKRFNRINWPQVIIPLIFATTTTYISIELTRDMDRCTYPQ